MQEITQNTFIDATKVINRPYLLYFFASWCKPCQLLKPILDQVSIERANEIDILLVDIDHSPDLTDKFNIEVVPTVLSVINNREITRFTGNKSQTFIDQFINTVIKEN
jgi:thioredoxin-like negative regulator of GroEL